jgi:hypothetical protein
MPRPLRPFSVLLLPVTLVVAPLAAQQTKPVQAIANVLMTMNHFPDDAQKQSLKQLTDDKATTAQERVLLQALLNVQHTLSAADKPKVEALLKDPAATDAVKTLATILGKLNHQATDADKAVLKKLIS